MGNIQSYDDKSKFFNSMDDTKSIVFCCNQWTQWFLNNKSLQNINLKIFATSPPFNIKQETLPNNIIKINVAVYGAGMLKELMSLLNFKPLKDYLNFYEIKISKFSFETFLQKKIPKVQTLIDYAKDIPDCKEGNIDFDAVNNLQNFVNEFQNLKSDDISTLDNWVDFLNKYNITYGSSVHYDYLLQYFGFSDETSSLLRNMKHEFVDKDETKIKTLEEYSLGWLGKFLCAYKPSGCYVDIIALIFIMMGGNYQNISEEETIKVINNFTRIIKNSEFKSLRIPTHIIHDSENDDRLAWGLLCYIHNCLNSKLETLVQLPTDSVYNDIELNYRNKGCSVFRDKDSSNMEALNEYFKIKG